MSIRKNKLYQWSIGVGSVIGGDFFGWTAILKGGISNAIISFILMSLLYFSLAKSISSLCNISRQKGAAHCFVDDGMGKISGIICAALETAKLMFVICAVSIGIASYVNVVDNAPVYFQMIFYIVLYFSFCLLNMFGSSVSGFIQTIITSCCLILLLFYWISISTTFNFIKYAYTSTISESDIYSFASSFPFCAWLLLGFEELPIVISNSNERDLQSMDMNKSSLKTYAILNDPSTNDDTDKNSSDGILISFITVCISGFLTLFLGASCVPGLEEISHSNSPLVSGIAAVYGSESPITSATRALVVVALASPFYSFILYASHHLQLLSHQKLLSVPVPIGCCHLPSPIVCSLTAIAVVGSAFSLLLTQYCGLEASANILISAVLLPAMLSYAMQLQALLLLQRRTAADGWDNDPLLGRDSALGTPDEAISPAEVRMAQLLCAAVVCCLLLSAAQDQALATGVVLTAASVTVLSAVMICSSDAAAEAVAAPAGSTLAPLPCDS